MDRIPVLKLGRALLVSIQADVHDRLASALEEDLSARIVATSARGVMIDISGVEIVDSFMGRMLNNISAVALLLGAQTVVVGMRPAVAITLVELGLSLEGVKDGAERGARDGADRQRGGRARTAGRRRAGGRWRKAGGKPAMIASRDEMLPIQQGDDVVRVRQAVRARAIEAGLGLVDQTKIVTAASELARKHAGLRRRRHGTDRGRSPTRRAEV